MTAAARLYSRLEPIAYDDDGTLQALCTALQAPVEICEISRDQDNGLVAWEALTDPDACPTELLDWLAIYNGVTLPASALTEDEKRSRIRQAAGRYRGTQRAWREEIQRSLTGTKTVRIITFVGGDRWAVAILTRTSETPDPAAVERTARAQKPAGIVLTFLVSDTPIWAEAGVPWTDVGVSWHDVTIDDVT
jgi:hypothetical protein